MTIHLISGREGTGKTTLCEVLTARGYPAIDSDMCPGLGVWLDRARDEPVQADQVPAIIDEDWVRSHDFIWDPQKVKELLHHYEGREAFICGSSSNHHTFFPFFGLRFSLWAQEGTIARRLQQRDSYFWRYESSELIRRLSENQASRTEAILNGNIIIYAELPAQQVADDIIAYISAARHPGGSLRYGSEHV